MAAGPRKFGEKIALLQQKEAEHTAEFEGVMASVKPITRQRRIGGSVGNNTAPQNAPSSHSPPHGSATGNCSPQHHTSPTRLSSATSDFSINLSPNNSLGGFYHPRDNVQEAVNDLHSLRKEVYSSSPHATASTTTISPSQRHYSPHHPHHRASTSPVTGLGGPHKGGVGAIHLSPPLDGLPRSNSVPSLHQNSVSSSYPVSPPHDGDHLLAVPYRPKSSLEVSPPHQSPNMAIPVTGLLQSLHQQQFGCGNAGAGSGLVGLAITGSLPDLSQRAEQLHAHNAMSSDDAGTAQVFSSSLTNGPYNSNNTGRGPPTSSPQGQSPQSGTSPGPSPSLSRRLKSSPYPTPISRSSTSQSNLLTVPTVVNSNFLHKSKGTVVDISAVDAGGGTPYTQHYSLFSTPPGGGGGSIPSSPNHSNPLSSLCHQQQQHHHQHHHQQQQQHHHPHHHHHHHQQQSTTPLHHHHQFQKYRNPPSPQLSPRSSPGPPNHHTATMAPASVGAVYRSSSPDARSAPPSPVGALSSAQQASPSPASSPGIHSKPFTYEQPYGVLHRFEQITVIDCPPSTIDNRIGEAHQSGPTQSQSDYNSPSPSYQSPASPTAQGTGGGGGSNIPPASPTTQTHPHGLTQIGALPGLASLQQQSNQMPSSPLQQGPASPTPSQGPHSPATPNTQQNMQMNPATPQTPQTPNSIPRVVLTDDDGNNDILRDFSAVFEGDPEGLHDIFSQIDTSSMDPDEVELEYSGSVLSSGVSPVHRNELFMATAGSAQDAHQFLQQQPQ